MGAVRSLCTTGLVLDEGRVAASGDIGRCIEAYFTQIGAFQSEDAGPGNRAGSGFGRAWIKGAKGSSILQSEPFEARTTLAVPPDVSGFSLFCIVEDMQNRMVFHLREESPSLGLAGTEAGEYAIAVTIPALWLNTGLYSLSFKALFWGGRGDARHVSDKIPLDVTGTHSKVDAILHPEAVWKVAPGGLP